MDFYEILEVSRTSTLEEIDKSYRRLARQYHPDRNLGDEKAVVKFKEVSTAYETLSDPIKKSHYDLIGHSNRKQSQPPNYSRPKTKTKEDFEREKSKEKEKFKPTTNQNDLDKIQCTFFGGSSTGRNVLVQMKLTPNEMKYGGKKEVIYKTRKICVKCIGDGDLMAPCPKCNDSNQLWCPECEGKGTLLRKCINCKGEGLSELELVTATVHWSRNTQLGHQITIIGAGEQAPKKTPGNLRVVVI